MNKFLTILFAFLSLISTAQINLQDSLVARYDLNGHAMDSSTNMHHGTIYGSTPGTDRHGNTSGCLQFDGINDYLDFGNIIDISQQSEITISAWFYVDPNISSNNRYSGISFGTKANGELTIRIMDETQNMFQSALYSTSLSSGNSSKSNIYNSNNWYHLVSTYQNGNVSLYVDGFLQNNTSSSGSGGQLSHIQQNSNLLVGKAFNSNNSERYYSGKIDDVRIYNRLLNDCEISFLYNGNLNLGQDSLIVHYPLDGNAMDYSGNNFNGTIVSASPTTDRSGTPNAALHFDGDEDYIFVGTILDPSIRSEMSIEGWFYMESPITTSNKYVGISFGNKLAGELALRVNEDASKRIQAFMSDGSSSSSNTNSTSSTSDMPFNYNTWYHLIATFLDGNINLYVDGMLQNTVGSSGTGGSFTSIPSISELLIGKTYNSFNQPRYFKGKMDEVKIYNKALTQCDVEEIYQIIVLSVPENELGLNNLVVYPNPANNYVHVNLENHTIQNLSIISLNGRVLLSYENPDKKIDISLLPSGVYILQVTDERGLTQNSRVIIY